MIKHFLPFYRPHLKLLILDLFAAMCLSLMELAFPILLREFVDKILPDRSIQWIIIFGISLVIIVALRYFFSYIMIYWGHTLGAKIEYDMRNRLLKHLQKLSFSFFDNNKTGHLMSKVVNDLFLLVEMAHHFPEDVFVSFVLITGSSIFMFTYNWMLTCILFLIIPVIVTFAFIYNIKMRKKFRVIREKVGDINFQVEDSLAGIRVVQSFTGEDRQMEKINRANVELRESRLKTFKIMAEFFSGITSLLGLINVIVLLVASVFILNGTLSIGELVAFLFFINLFLTPVHRLINSTEYLQQGLSGFKRYLEIMDTNPDIKDKPGAKELTEVRGDIKFEEVTFSYENDIHVLKGINLHLKPGTKAAVVGPSGGGKSTLCSLIPRYYEVDSGRILIDDHPVTDVTCQSLRNQIGVVQQDVFLFTGTIRENLLFARPEATAAEMIHAAKAANAHEFIIDFEKKYDTYIGEKGIKLSGGQKQRLSIARMFLKNPPILILDEATSSVDNESERRIQNSLKDLAKDRTTLIIAHRLSTVQDADIILVLTEEGIQEQGTHEELLENKGLYSELYKTHTDILIQN